jgi:hypothetical protein
MVELFTDGGAGRRAALVSRDAGQRMAALPAALAALALDGETAARGALTACELLGARPLVDALVADGCELVIDSGGRIN